MHYNTVPYWYYTRHARHLRRPADSEGMMGHGIKTRKQRLSRYPFRILFLLPHPVSVGYLPEGAAVQDRDSQRRLTGPAQPPHYEPNYTRGHKTCPQPLSRLQERASHPKNESLF